jgi:hypothetical protein
MHKRTIIGLIASPIVAGALGFSSMAAADGVSATVQVNASNGASCTGSLPSGTLDLGNKIFDATQTNIVSFSTTSSPVQISCNDKGVRIGVMSSNGGLRGMRTGSIIPYTATVRWEADATHDQPHQDATFTTSVGGYSAGGWATSGNETTGAKTANFTATFSTDATDTKNPTIASADTYVDSMNLHIGIAF